MADKDFKITSAEDIKAGAKPVFGINADNFAMPLYRYDENTGRAVEKRDSGGTMVSKAGRENVTDPEKARVGDYYYDNNGNLNVVKNSPTDVFNRFKITEDMSLKSKPTRESVDNLEGLAMPAISSTAVAAAVGARAGAGAVAGAAAGLLPALAIGGVISANAQMAKEKAYRAALEEWQKSQENAVWQLAGDLKVDDKGKVIFDPDMSKAINMNQAFAGSEVQKAFNRGTNVYFGDDGRLKVEVNPIFAATDDYKEMVDKIKTAYSGLTKDTDNVDEYIEEIKNYIDNGNNQFKFREESMYSYKNQLPNASNAVIEDAYPNELGAYMSEKDGGSYTVKVYRGGDVKETTAQEVLETVYKMDKGKRSDYMLDLYQKMEDPSIPEDKKAYILSEIKMIQAADSNDQKYDNGSKDANGKEVKTVNKYYGMLDQDSIISILNNWSIIGGLSFTDLINALDCITPWDMHTSKQEGLQEDKAAASAARLISTATSAITSYYAMQGIEHGIIRPVASKLGNAISTGIDNTLSNLAAKGGRLSDIVGKVQLTLGAAGDAIEQGSNAIARIIQGAKLAAGPMIHALGYSMSELLYNATSDLIFDALKQGARAMAGDNPTGEEFLEEFGTDLMMDLVMQYGPVGLSQMQMEMDNYRLDAAFEPYKAGIESAQKKLTDIEIQYNAAKNELEGMRKGTKKRAAAEENVSKLEKKYNKAKNSYDKLRTTAEEAVKQAMPSASEELGAMLAGKFASIERNKVVMWLRKKLTDEKAGLTTLAEQAYHKTGDVYLYSAAINKFQNIQSGINEITAKMKSDMYAKGTGSAYRDWGDATAAAFPSGKFPKEKVNYLIAKSELDAWTAYAKGDEEIIAKAEEKYLPYIEGIDSEDAKQLDKVLDTMKKFLGKVGESYVNSGAATKQQVKDIEEAALGNGYVPLWGKGGETKKYGLFETPLTMSVGRSFDESKGMFDVEDIANPVDSACKYVHNVINNIARNEMAGMLKDIASIDGVGVEVFGQGSAGAKPEFQDIIDEAIKNITTSKEKLLEDLVQPDKYLEGLEKTLSSKENSAAISDIDKLLDFQKRIKEATDAFNDDGLTTAAEPTVKTRTAAEWKAAPQYDDEYFQGRAADVIDGKASYDDFIKEQRERMWASFKDSNRGTDSFLQTDANGDVHRYTLSDNGTLYRQLYEEYSGKPSKQAFNEAFDDVLKNGENSKYYEAFKEFDPEGDYSRGYNQGNGSIDDIIMIRMDHDENAAAAKAIDTKAAKVEKLNRLLEINKIKEEMDTLRAKVKEEIATRIRAAGEYFNATYKDFGVTVDVESYLKSSKFNDMVDAKLASISQENMITLKDDVAHTIGRLAPYLSMKNIDQKVLDKQTKAVSAHVNARIKKDHPDYSVKKKNYLVGQAVNNFKAQLSGDYSKMYTDDSNAVVDGAYKIGYTLDGKDASFYLKGPMAKEIAAEMNTKNVADRRALTEFLKEAANIKRLLTTGVDPTRVIPNLLRDTIRNGVMSGGTDYWFFDNSPFGFVEMFTKMARAAGDTDENIQKALATMGAVQEAVSGSTFNEAMNGRRTNAAKRLVQSSVESGKNRGTRFVWNLAHNKKGMLEAPMNWAEGLTRDRASASAFMRAYFRGANTIDADTRLNNAYEAGLNAGRENTVNFSRRGTFIGEIASYVPYLSQRFSTIESTKIAFLKDPIGVSSRLMLFGAAYMMELSRVLSDEESRKNYYNLSEYDRENNIILSLGGDLVTIPLDETLSALIYPWRRGLETMHNVDPEYFYKIMVNGLLELSPFDLSGFTEGDSFNFGRGVEKLGAQVLPTILQFAYTQASGRSMYYGSQVNVTKESLAEYGNYDPTFGDYTTTGKNSQLLRGIADALGIEQWRLQQGISDLGGNVGQYVVNWLDKIAHAPEDAQGGKDFVDATFKSFTGMDSTQVSYAFTEGINKLTDEKEKLKGRLATMNEQISLASGERLVELQNQYKKTKQEFAMKVGSFIDKYINGYEIAGGLTKAQANKIWYLLNFSDDDSTAMSGTVESYYRDLAKKQANNEATKYSANVLDKYYDQTKNVYKDSSGEWHYYSPYGEQAFFNTVQGRGMEYQVGLRNIVEGKVNDLSGARSAAYDARNAAANAGNWDEYDKIGLRFDEQVLNTIAPYVKRYGAENVLSNSSVLDYLEEWFFVPSSYMKSKYGKNVSLAHNASKQRAFVRPYIKQLFGLSTSYNEKNYASRPENLVREGKE